MTEPVYVGMPNIDRRFDVGHWGEIRCGGRCRDDYGRLETVHQDGRVITLQRAALDSFKSAEKEVGGLIRLTGAFRACSYQTALYRSDSGRFANPDTSAHCRGLAIDVSTNQAADKLKRIRATLMERHWHQARPTDEPWHYSFGLQV